MATFASSLSFSPPPPLLFGHRLHLHHRCSPLRLLIAPLRSTISAKPRELRTFVLASSDSASSFDGPFRSISNRAWHPPDKKTVLSDLIQAIEPLDVSFIQKDVPPTTLDAMKRTISGMLGLLPSDRFRVSIEALWEPLSKLFVSSMMTGYTLRNAEYRLCLERSLDMDEGNLDKQESDSKSSFQETSLDNTKPHDFYRKNVKSDEITDNPSNSITVQGLGEMSAEAQQYILHLQSQLSSVKKELHEVKRKMAAIQMQQFVGEEKNDLLDYLRSLQPEKLLQACHHSLVTQVAELSEPTCPELKETIHSVVHGLLATLSPKMHCKAPSPGENASTGTLNVGGEDCAELVENTSLHFQPLISLTRDHLARLLFWCMLLGHYLRGQEYRMELMELLSLTTEVANDNACGDEQVA